MHATAGNYRKREYWIVENAQYLEASFRLFKCAQLINGLSQDTTCSLLDVGCGPGALRTLLTSNIRYYGLDIAIQKPAPYFREVDFARNEISFEGKRFDFITALGVFEYMGEAQNKKFLEIRDNLHENGKFIMSYINFEHFRRRIWGNYNNVQSIAAMKKSLEQTFEIQRCFPASHHWRQKQPGKFAIPAIQMHVNFNIPFLSPRLAVEYFFICSRRR